MCGICGKIHHDPERPVERSLIEAMHRRLAHRGPDDAGFHFDGPVALAHNRLSIIDRAGGHQPIYNEDRSCCIVFNGEIYNFRDLRRDLTARGHVFTTRSDTETILHLYEDKGVDCVDDLRGMFAFAIWDGRSRELLLARDRVGKKPLFYAETPDGFVFASEMKALLADPTVARDVDPEAVQAYLGFQYVPPPGSIFKGVHKLPPAHTLVWSDGHARVRRYWTLNYEPKRALGEAEACEQVRQHIDEAVRVRLESEAPMGCLLSGGIDSSAVVAFMRRHITGELRTFSIGFDESSHNELPFARAIAERFETRHEEFVVSPKAMAVLPRLVWHADEPFSDSSALPTYHVAEITRRHVTVALNGDGGDESFAGYTRYRGDPRVLRYLRLPRLMRRGLMGPTLSALAALRPSHALVEQARYLNELSLMPPARQYAQYMLIFRDYQRRTLYGERLAPMLGSGPPADDLVALFQQPARSSEIDRKLGTDVESYLPGDLLVKMDRMAMAHSLEGRSPFLDHHLMAFAASLPGEMKFPGGELKGLLKRALEPVLPREILYRKKMGFGVPLRDWFRAELAPMTRDLLLSPRARDRGFFRPDYVAQLIDQHVARRQNHHHRLWSLLCFEVWCRTFLDADGTAPIEL